MTRKQTPTPDNILQLGFGFMASKTVLSAIELKLFTLLAKGPLDCDTLTRRLKLSRRSTRDFFDALVALKLLDRRNGLYRNCPDADLFLDAAKPTYVGGLLEMINARLYRFWGSLTEALRTGEPQNEARTGGNIFDALYSDPQRLSGFLKAMTGISLGAAHAIAKEFPWKKYKSFADIGAAEGALPVQVALRHKHLIGIGYDLPVVKPHFERYVRAQGLEHRLHFHSGNFFKEPLPKTDVLVMGHILHDWNLKEKRMLVAKAYKALPPGGALIAYDAMIDDDRRSNVIGFLASLNMLIETKGGFDYTGADCKSWMREAGFSKTRVEHLVGPDSMVIGIK